MNVSKILIRLDQLFDYIPVASSITNLVDLLAKGILTAFVSKETISKNRYFTHLDQKNAGRCAVLLFPGIGNVPVWIGHFAPTVQKSAPSKSSVDNSPSAPSPADLALAKLKEKGKEGIREIDPKLLANENFMLNAIRIDVALVSSAAEILQRSEEFQLKAIYINPDVVNYAFPGFKTNQELILKSITPLCKVFKHIDESLKKDRAFVLKALSINALVLEYLPDDLRNDKEIVVKALKSAWSHRLDVTLVAPFVGDILRANEDFVLEQIKNFYYKHIALACDKLMKDPQFIKKAVEACGLVLQQLEENYRGNREIVTAAVKQNCTALRFVGAPLDKDVDFQKELIGQFPEAFGYSCLCNKREYALEMILKDPKAFLEVDNSLRKDESFILDAVAVNHAILKHLDPDLLKNKAFMLKVVAINGLALQYVKDYVLRGDKELNAAAIAQNSAAIAFASDSYSSNREGMLALVKQDGMLLQHGRYGIRDNKEIVLAAGIQNPKALQFADQAVLKDWETMLTLITAQPETYKYTPLKDNRSFVQCAMLLNPLILEHASPEQQNDAELVKIALQKNAEAMKFASKELQAKFAS